MRLLVTGSSGYLGSLVLPALAAAPDVSELVGLDVRPPARAPAGFRHHTGSVLDPGLGEWLARERVARVLHLAWVFNPTHDRDAMRAVDVGGTRNVFEAAARAGVAHVVYLSSTTAYGAHADNPPRLLESHPRRGNADFPYAADKAEVEAWLDEFEPRHPGLGVTRVRPCIVLGGATDNFVRALLDLPVMVQPRGSDPELQLLHEEDLVDCLVALARRCPRGAFNVAPAETVRLSEAARLLRKPLLRLPPRLLRAGVALAWHARLLGVPPSYLEFLRWPWVADASRLEREVGLRPRRSSREALLALASTRRRPL